jgi:hypothetical protein
MSASNLKFESRQGVRHKPRRILSIVSNTAQLKGFPVGFFAEEMTRASSCSQRPAIVWTSPRPKAGR